MQASFEQIISSIQKIALYETRMYYYLVGSNNTQTKFHVLKIDRNKPWDLCICDDKVEYNGDAIRKLVNIIDHNSRATGGLKVISAFGIVGFIRFLEGYYIVLITKRCKVAHVGYHAIFKIENTTMIYIPHESVRVVHPDEPRYVKMFQNIDLASNFYFSYSYDLTHSLQHNIEKPRFFQPIGSNIESKAEMNLANEGVYGVRAQPQTRFVWNAYLLREIEANVHPDWLLYIIHGFVGQSNLNVFGKPLYITLLARRSAKYAGTRFLKRGSNYQGDVANEVETEQMVHDSGVSSFSLGQYTSFVQMRGSIPGYWRQEMGKMVAKPAITIDLYDPYYESAGAHFGQLLARYGAPIVILNLVKQRERKPQEGLLSEEFAQATKYLNQFLGPDHQIIYKSFDMARKTKANANVMGHLADIARYAVHKVGMFFSCRTTANRLGLLGSQTGIIRTNCVDCLDRTNTAQFAFGKYVLGYQLYALGVLTTPHIEFDTDCVRMLECLYEDHGDTLALQYGGSQLVHRIKTYRKMAPWTCQGNDIMQTLSRYYSNTFSDAEKQNAINLFLGLFRPRVGVQQLWDLQSDHSLHHIRFDEYSRLQPLTQWWEDGVIENLPRPTISVNKTCTEIIQFKSLTSVQGMDMVDAFNDYHRPFELSVLKDMFVFNMSHTIRDFMPNFTTDFSPFVLRIRPVKRRDESGRGRSGVNIKNPSVSGQSSTSSTASTSNSSSDNDDLSNTESDSLYNADSLTTSVKDTNSIDKYVSLKSLFPTMNKVYGSELKEPPSSDLLTYKKYVLVGMKASGTARNIFTGATTSVTSSESLYEFKPAKVSKASIDIYTRYVQLGISGPEEPIAEDMAIYQRYVHDLRIF